MGLKMNKQCAAHETAIQLLNTQINGIDGKGGLVEQMNKIEDRVESLHTKLTFGIGFITAIQILIPILYPTIAKAFDFLTK
jgi:hypothetical protein